MRREWKGIDGMKGEWKRMKENRKEVSRGMKMKR